MSLDASALDSYRIGHDARFHATMADLIKTDLFIASLVSEVPMGHKSIDFGWLGLPGMPHEWKKGEGRHPVKLRADNYLVSSRRWEHSLVIDEEDILDDETDGIEYRSRIDDQVLTFFRHKEKQIVEALLAGFATDSEFGTCYDGQAFFSHTHPCPDADVTTTWDNLMHHTLDDAGALDDAVALFDGVKCDDGSPAEVGDETTKILLIGTGNRANARTVIDTQTAVGNSQYKRFPWHVTPWIRSGVSRPSRAFSSGVAGASMRA